MTFDVLIDDEPRTREWVWENIAATVEMRSVRMERLNAVCMFDETRGFQDEAMAERLAEALDANGPTWWHVEVRR
jgi:hypothetical protein